MLQVFSCWQHARTGASCGLPPNCALIAISHCPTCFLHRLLGSPFFFFASDAIGSASAARPAAPTALSDARRDKVSKESAFKASSSELTTITSCGMGLASTASSYDKNLLATIGLPPGGLRSRSGRVEAAREVGKIARPSERVTALRGCQTLGIPLASRLKEVQVLRFLRLATLLGFRALPGILGRNSWLQRRGREGWIIYLVCGNMHSTSLSMAAAKTNCRWSTSVCLQRESSLGG